MLLIAVLGLVLAATADLTLGLSVAVFGLVLLVLTSIKVFDRWI